MNISLSPTSRTAISLHGSYTDDRYSGTTLGLRDGTRSRLLADASWMPSQRVKLLAFASIDRYERRQLGSLAFSDPDWSARFVDDTQSLGVGGEWLSVRPRLDLGVTLSGYEGEGRTTVDRGSSDPAFPVLRTSRRRFDGFARYHFSADLTARLDYRHERYRSQDWQLDGVDLDTVSNFMSMGAESPDHDVNLVTLTARYRF